jgi:hypothetical protein
MATAVLTAYIANISVIWSGRCWLNRVLAWASFIIRSPELYIYIYSLYIKSPGLPIIEEAQDSQYAHWG